MLIQVPSLEDTHMAINTKVNARYSKCYEMYLLESALTLLACLPTITQNIFKQGILNTEESEQSTYTVFLSCLRSLEENSLNISRNAKCKGGWLSPCGLGSLKANSMPSLKNQEPE